MSDYIYKPNNTCFYDAISAKWLQLNCLTISDGTIVDVDFTDCVEEKKYSRYILPGLIDAHCHILENPYDEELTSTLHEIALKNALDACKCGITTLKDMGGFSFKPIGIVNRLNKNYLPRIYTSGCFFTCPGGHCHDRGAVVVTDILQFKNAISKLISSDIHFCKILHGDNAFSFDLLESMIEFAHSNDLLVSCHAYTEKAAFEAVLAGTDTLEHAGDYSDSLLQMIKKRNVIIIPTYVASVDSTLDNCKTFSDINGEVLKSWIVGEKKVIPKLFENNLMVALGTDSGFSGTPCDSLIREIKLLNSDFGISIERILFSDLITTPQALMLGDKLGRIAQGYYADFSCYKDNPLTNLDLLGYPEEVWISGERVDNKIANHVTLHRLAECDVSSVSLYLHHYSFDCGAICDCWSDSELEEWFSVEEDYCIGAFFEKTLIGFCLTHYHKATNKVHLENIYVLEQYRRNGVAQRLMYDVLSYYSKKSSLTRFIGMVNLKNKKPKRMLDKNDFITGYPMYWMQRNVNDDI